mmetsp:Transcript_174340/g.558882  ORF Transcript_174340/g.558882 Transcript_174340/m.558882 type:complete len:312 (-) Transcript_174340:125-1060(-)
MGFKIDEIVHPDSRGVAQQFECSVCMCVVNEPLQTVCDHIFCAECISTCLACPTCRTAFGDGACKPLRDCNRPLMRMIHNLQVWCPYHAESKFVPPDEDESADDTEIVEDVDEPAAKRKRVDSCDWAGSYSDLLAKHLAMCQHHFVPCPRGCGRQVRRGGLEAHAPVCAKNFETCKLCHEAVRVGDMSQHRQDKAELHVQLLEARLAERGDGGDLQRSLDRIHERLANLESARARHISRRECASLSEIGHSPLAASILMGRHKVTDLALQFQLLSTLSLLSWSCSKLKLSPRLDKLGESLPESHYKRDCCS